MIHVCRIGLIQVDPYRARAVRHARSGGPRKERSGCQEELDGGVVVILRSLARVWAR